MQIASDDDIWASFDRMQDRASTLTQMASGWTFSEHGLLASRPLRRVLKPVTTYMHDFMHGVLQGCMPVAMFLILEALRAAGLQSWKSMGEWCKLWVLPSAYSIDMPGLFQAKRIESHRKVERFKAPAAEILALYPIMRQYVFRIGMLAETARKQCEAFLAVCHFLDLLLAAQSGKVTGVMLDLAATAIMQSFAAASWEDYLIKKFHWNFHYGDSLVQQKCLLNCFACERKHRQVVRHGDLICNLAKYEDSVYRELLCDQLHSLQQPLKPEVDLVNHSKAPAALKKFLLDLGLVQPGQNCTTCSSIHVPTGTLRRGDVVLLTTGTTPVCGQLWCCFAVDGETAALVGCYSLRSRKPAEGSALWKEDDAPIVVQADCLICPLPYSRTSEGLLTLIPWQWQ